MKLFNRSGCGCKPNGRCGCNSRTGAPVQYNQIGQRFMKARLNQDENETPVNWLQEILGIKPGEPIAKFDIGMTWPTLLKLGLVTGAGVALGSYIAKKA